MIFNSPLVFRIPFNLFHPSTSIVSTTTTFFSKFRIVQKYKTKIHWFPFEFFEAERKKATELVKQSYQTYLRALARRTKKQAFKMT